MATYEVAVVGGGLVGTATAYELGLRGVRTLLVDRADPGRATDAGAGILSPETTKRDDPNWVELVRAAGAHYERLVPRLGPDTGWDRCGILQLATRESDIPAWEWVARARAGRGRDQRRRSPRDGAGARRRGASPASPRGGSRRRPDDVCRVASRRGLGARCRCSPRVGRRRTQPPGRRGRDRGRRVDERGLTATRSGVTRRPPARSDHPSRRRRPGHGRVADRATGVRLLHGAVGRRAGRGRRDSRRRGFRGAT